MKPWGTLTRVLTLCALAVTVAACGHNRAVSVTGGEARAIKPPEYEVRGATPYDQAWIDDTIERGVAGLGWDRPQPRPEAFDAPVRTSPKVAPPPTSAPEKKKPPFWKGWRPKKPATS